MKVLVTGANGLLGQHLVNVLVKYNLNVIATGRGGSRLPITAGRNYRYYDADLTSYEAMLDIFEAEKPEIVVHAAAMTQLDDCQLQQEACFQINVQATSELLLLAERHSKFFIYISTDFVFDGNKGNYGESDALNPVSWYGFTKMQAETIVAKTQIPWAIVRTCLVYGNTYEGTRSNIISWVKTNLEQEKEIKVVSDQVRTPTFVGDLAKGILLVIQKQAKGIFHISGKDALTPYEIALATAAYFNLNKTLIQKVDASTFTQPAKRPPITGFNISKAREQLGFEPVSFAEGMRKMFEEMGNGELRVES